MKQIRLFVVVPFLLAAAQAVENQAFWGIFAETTVSRNAGMPDMSAQLKGMDPAMLQHLPANVRAMMAGGPQRRLTMRLWSPGIAPEDATATVVPPAGLKQGERLELALYRPKPSEGTAGAEGAAGGEVMPARFTIKRYWGSSATVKEGQPEVVTIETIPAEDRARIREEMRRAQSGEGGSYFYKPNWTTGYWPTSKQPGQIDPAAALTGTFTLATSYTGGIALDVPRTVDFLAGIELESPDLSHFPDLARALAFRWKPIANLLGSHARIIGMVGKDTLILWSSSEVREEFSADHDFMQMAEVREQVGQRKMMAGDRTEVTVPAGIFKDCDYVSMQMVGYGTGTARDEGQPLPRLQTKTSLSAMLGGKKAARMGRD